MRILDITNQIPFPLMSGAPLRTYNILRRLARDHEVFLAAFAAGKKQEEGVSHLLEFCREVVTAKHRNLRDGIHPGRILTSVLRREPPEIRIGFSDELADRIRQLADRVDFDVVLVEHGSMGLYLDALPQHLQQRAVWVLHDIDFDKFMRIARIEPSKQTKLRAWVHARMMRRWEPQFANHFGLCVTMSEADRQILLAANESLRVEVSPNGVDTTHFRPLPDEGETHEMLFIGNMGYQPNVDASIYFCNEVLPIIREEVVDSKLWIVGIDADASVQRLEGNGVFVTGGVPDVVPYYERSSVCVVPLRAGSGTRLKILEAMALGRAVVTTSIGCEGLEVVDGEHLMVADDSKRFAEQIVKLLTDRELRARIAARAREFVVASYDWDAIANRLMDSLDGVANQGRQSSACLR